MKKIITLVLAFAMLVGCSSSVSQEDYDKLKSEYDTVVAERDEMKKSQNSAPSQVADLPTTAPSEQAKENQNPEQASQTVKPEVEKDNSSSSVPAPKSASGVTMGQKNALAKAKNYLSIMAFSYKGLVTQLEFEGFSNEDATYGAENCGANWNEQSAKKAKSYLDIMPFSRDGLITQLEFDGFTSAQAAYGVEQNGY